MVATDGRQDWVDKVTAKYARDKERPRQNTVFLLFLGLAGVALVIAMPILATQELQARDNCECHVPAQSVNGATIEPTHEKCMTDMDYNDCYTTATNQYTIYAGISGLGGGLILLSLIGLRYL